MPTRKKQTSIKNQKIEKPVVIVLCLPLVCLGVFLVVVLLNNKAASGKPGPVAAVATPSPAASPTAAVTTAVPTTPATVAATTTPVTIATATTLSSATIAVSSPNPATTAATTRATIAIRTVKPGPPEGTGIRLTKTESGIKFDLLVSPGHIGNNNYFVLLSENGNQAVNRVSLVRLAVTSVDMDMGVANLDLQPAGDDQPGLYTGIDNKLQMLSMVGKFNLGVLVQRSGQSDVSATFELDVKGS